MAVLRPIIDSHLDLAWSALYWNRDLTKSIAEVRASEQHIEDHPARGRNTVTLPEMRRSNIRICLATVLSRSKPDVNPPQGSTRRDLDFRTQIHAGAVGRSHVEYYRLLEQLGLMTMIRSVADLDAHVAGWNRSGHESQPLGYILAMEGADPIVSPQQAEEWWNFGLRCVSLVHYGQGPYAAGTGVSGPVTPRGRELLSEFKRLGFIVDLTHTTEPGFFEVLELFDGPVHASHNMCQAITPGDRQFSDEQIRALVARDAVIGVALDAWMIRPGWRIGFSSPDTVSMEDVANHIDHISQLTGTARHIGIGSDLDGGFGTEQTPGDMDTIYDLHKLESILERRGYSSEDIDGIFYGNWLRHFRESLPATSV